MAGPDNIQISLVCFIYLMTYRDVSESDATAQTMWYNTNDGERITANI